jgi:thioredoxin 1
MKIHKQKFHKSQTIILLATILFSCQVHADVKSLTTSNFSSTIKDTDLPVVVDFWAPWCPPCRDLAPIIEELAKKTSGKAIVAKVNIDDHPALAQQYGVQAIPTILFFERGTVKTQLRGVQSLDTLMSNLNISPETSTKETGKGFRKGRSMLNRLEDVDSAKK